MATYKKGTCWRCGQSCDPESYAHTKCISDDMVLNYGQA